MKEFPWGETNIQLELYEVFHTYAINIRYLCLTFIKAFLFLLHSFTPLHLFEKIANFFLDYVIMCYDA